MSEQEMEKEIQRLRAENETLVATCHDLGSKLAALAKRVQRMEADFYKDLPVNVLDV